MNSSQLRSPSGPRVPTSAPAPWGIKTSGFGGVTLWPCPSARTVGAAGAAATAAAAAALRQPSPWKGPELRAHGCGKYRAPKELLPILPLVLSARLTPHRSLWSPRPGAAAHVGTIGERCRGLCRAFWGSPVLSGVLQPCREGCEAGGGGSRSRGDWAGPHRGR